jgi:hypothetical protein
MELRLDRRERLYVLTLHAGEVRQVLRIHPTHLRVVRSDLEGVPSYDLAYDHFRQHEGVVFPTEVTLRSEAADILLRLRYTDFTLNEAPDLTLFEPTPPEGLPVVEVDELGKQLPRLELPDAPPGS